MSCDADGGSLGGAGVHGARDTSDAKRILKYKLPLEKRKDSDDTADSDA